MLINLSLFSSSLYLNSKMLPSSVLDVWFLLGFTPYSEIYLLCWDIPSLLFSSKRKGDIVLCFCLPTLIYSWHCNLGICGTLPSSVHVCHACGETDGKPSAAFLREHSQGLFAAARKITVWACGVHAVDAVPALAPGTVIFFLSAFFLPIFCQ